MAEPAVPALRRLTVLPAKAYLAILGVVCLGLAVSAAWNLLRLSKLQVEFLRSTAGEIGASMEAQLRGPARRADPTAWQVLFAELIGSRGQSVAFLALLDESGQVSASGGDRFAAVFTGPLGFVRTQGTRLYVSEFKLPVTVRQGGQGADPGLGTAMGQRLPGMLRIGLYASSSDFIRRRAIIHVAINGVAILVLLALARKVLRANPPHPLQK